MHTTYMHKMSKTGSLSLGTVRGRKPNQDTRALGKAS